MWSVQRSTWCGLATTPIVFGAAVLMYARLHCAVRSTNCSTRVAARPEVGASWACCVKVARRLARFRMRRLTRELGLVSKQPGSHAYKQATVERPDILNLLNREFTTERPNQVWCDDITYIWAQGRWYWR